MRKLPALTLILVILVSACTRTAPVKTDSTPTAMAVTPILNPSLPTGVSLQTYLPPTRAPGVPIASPTANENAAILEVVAFPTFTPLAPPTEPGSTPQPTGITYTVQAGDYPSSIAEQFGITTDELLAANNIGADVIIYPGDTLLVPVTGTPQAANGVPGQPGATTEYFKILPDSELVYGPLSALLDVDKFVHEQGGHLAFYSQEIDGETLNGAQIVTRVSQFYSVNPRLLLALLEYRSQWVTNRQPAASTMNNPIGYVDNAHEGLYRQLTWSADMLNQGFYRWKERKLQNLTLTDGSLIAPQPGINPGTAGVQHLFAKLDSQDTWQIDTGPDGLYATYNKMFGYPFDFAVEPLLPSGLIQPVLTLPFGAGEAWLFTGGPHGGWDQGSGWAALDFAPPGEPIGCGSTEAWVTASAPGLIVRAGNGAVIQDLDGDGLEQTGWTILYMHIAASGRIQPGTRVQVGDKIGHSSCEGGFANANHLHLARRYNGVWIPAADPNTPFVLSGFVPSGNDVEYDGWLTGGGKTIEAIDGSSPLNEISH